MAENDGIYVAKIALYRLALTKEPDLRRIVLERLRTVDRSGAWDCLRVNSDHPWFEGQKAPGLGLPVWVYREVIQNRYPCALTAIQALSAHGGFRQVDPEEYLINWSAEDLRPLMEPPYWDRAILNYLKEIPELRNEAEVILEGHRNDLTRWIR